MILELNEKEEAFSNMLESLFCSSDAEILSPIKQKAWQHFKTLGLPSKKVETYAYVPLRKVFEKNFATKTILKLDVEVPTDAILPECEGSIIVLVNGQYVEKLSNRSHLPSKIVISSIQDAMKTYGSFITNHFVRTLKEEIDPFVAVNGALNQHGVFIYIPPNMRLEHPIQILNILSNDTTLFLNSRIQVFAASQSRATVISSSEISKSSFFNHVSDFALEDNAQITYIQALENTPKDALHFDATRAFLKKNSQFNAFAVSKGSLTTRTDYRISLNGENGSSSLHGLWMLKDTDEFHANVLIDHQAPFCQSRQLFKGVLDDSSKSSFEGKVLVRQPALKTDAFQLNNNLLLHDYASAYSKPNLEIYADDVKASHGATYGGLDAEQLFCLRSRGIQPQDAKNLLIYGFCEDLIGLIPLPSLQKKLREQAKQYRAKD